MQIYFRVRFLFLFDWKQIYVLVFHKIAKFKIEESKELHIQHKMKCDIKILSRYPHADWSYTLFIPKEKIASQI